MLLPSMWSWESDSSSRSFSACLLPRFNRLQTRINEVRITTLLISSFDITPSSLAWSTPSFYFHLSSSLIKPWQLKQCVIITWKEIKTFYSHSILLNHAKSSLTLLVILLFLIFVYTHWVYLWTCSSSWNIQISWNNIFFLGSSKFINYPLTTM